MAEEFEGWISQQPEPIQAMFREHLDGLTKALDAERAEVERLTAIQTRAQNMESDLADLTARATRAQNKAQFFESATKARCLYPVAAYNVAEAQGLISDGHVDWDGVRKAVPEAFVYRYAGSADGGSGTTGPTRLPGNGFMNKLLRRMAVDSKRRARG